MAVGILAWPLIQMGWVLPIAGQFPQYKPCPQSVAAEHDSINCAYNVILERFSFKFKQLYSHTHTHDLCMITSNTYYINWTWQEPSEQEVEAVMSKIDTNKKM